MKTFYFTDDSYWDDNGCSCCEPTLMTAYNCANTEYYLGTAHSLEECYYQSIVTCLGSSVPEEFHEELQSMDINQIKSLAQELCIRVKIQ